jgi:glutamate synthase (NADPH/NADH) small chain
LLTNATPDLKLNKWGYIQALDDFGKTSKAGVWAGGDIIRGAATVILAMGDGKKSSVAIDHWLREKHNRPQLDDTLAALEAYQAAVGCEHPA